MGKIFSLFIISGLASFAAYADKALEGSDIKLPSKELLDFLVEFEGMNDETFEAVLFYGQRDVYKASNNTDDESVNGEAKNEEL